MLRQLFASALLLVAAADVTAQTAQDFTRVYGPGDRDLPTPKHSAKTATDAAALQKVLAFVKASGVTAWKGFTAEGTITFTGDQTSYPAHVAVLGSDRYRLDVDKPDGKESTIFSGETGVFIPAQGARSSVSSDVSTLGLLAFPRLLSADYPKAKSLLSDQGTATLGGKSLWRVTLDDPAADEDGAPWKTQDLYFEAATGFLAKSAAFVHLSSADRALYLLAVDYGDYRAAGSKTLLPYSYTQSLNGNPLWTLQLTSVSLSTLPDPTLFQF